MEKKKFFIYQMFEKFSKKNSKKEKILLKKERKFLKKNKFSKNKKFLKKRNISIKK